MRKKNIAAISIVLAAVAATAFAMVRLVSLEEEEDVDGGEDCEPGNLSGVGTGEGDGVG